jgi:hypothetical protein
MKKLSLCLICFASFFIYGCPPIEEVVDNMSITEIEIINDSSYDLNITFKEIPPYRGFAGEIYLLKTESCSLYIYDGCYAPQSKRRKGKHHI